MRQAKYLISITLPLREQVRDNAEFVRIVWEEIEHSPQENGK
jgi:hypothetical protein